MRWPRLRGPWPQGSRTRRKHEDASRSDGHHGGGRGCRRGVDQPGLPWFEATTKFFPQDEPVTGETTGWHFMKTTDIVIAILAVLAIGLLLINRERL